MGEVLAIIPARSGSKSVKDKNIRLINGKPMIAYSIGHALQANCIDRVIVSTDSSQYAEIASPATNYFYVDIFKGYNLL